MRIGRFLVAASFAGYAALHVLGRVAGSTAQERRAALPGDDVVVRPQMLTNHAITIDAPPEAVWPWLTQMGWHLGGFYTPRWVDGLLFPANWSSLDHLDPALIRDLQPGDRIPDGPPDTAWYVVETVAAPHTLVLHSSTHVPPGWADRFGAQIDWTWSFLLTALADGRTRLHLRVRGRMAPRWLSVSYLATLVPADFVMAGGMLRGIKRRAESGAPLRSLARPPLAASTAAGAPAERPADGSRKTVAMARTAPGQINHGGDGA